MTDNEIARALECCTHDSTYCPKCPMDGNSYCRGELIEYSYDLIKRQQAEIKRLKEPKFKMVNIGARGSGKTLGMYRLIYQQGIKEFAEKLHELLKFYYPEQKFVHAHIDNLVKEMTE